MNDAEVIQVVNSVVEREARQIEEQLVESAPPQQEWPVMGKEAFHGLLGEVVREIEPETEADPAAVLMHLLAMFGNAVGRTAHAFVGPAKHYPNIYVVVAGKSAKARKGTSGDMAAALFGPELTNRIKSGLSSGEGIISQVTDAVYKRVAGKGDAESRQVIDIPEAADKRLIVIESEYGSMLTVMRREGSTLSAVVRNAWDGKTLATMTKVERTATNAHVSIVGHVTVPELRGKMLDVEMMNGFANRFLWVAARRSKFLPGGGKQLDLSDYNRRIDKAVRDAQQLKGVFRDAETEAYWKVLYEGELAREYPGIIGSITSRSEPQTLRLSLIYALADGSPVIRMEHLEAALAVWRYCLASARMIFGESTGDSLADKLLTLIREKSRTTAELYGATNNHAKRPQLVAALDLLQRSRFIGMKEVPTGGRPAKVWSICP